MAEATSIIERYLRQTRQRQLWAILAVVTLTSTASSALGLLCLLGLATVLPHSHVVRALVLLGMLAAIAATVIYATSRLRRLRDPDTLARLLGDANPTLRSDLLSTVQLLHRPMPAGFSPRLVDALRAQLAERITQAIPHKPLSRRRLRLPIVLALVAFVSWVATTSVRPGFVPAAVASLLPAPAGEAARAQDPVVDDLNLTYRYPKYMERPVQHVRNCSGDISAPAGTEVSFSGKALLSLNSAQLRVRPAGRRPEQIVALRVTAHRHMTGHLRVGNSGRYTIEVRAEDGRRMRDPVERTIAVEADLGPKVVLEGPADYTVVDPTQRVEVAFAAEDDWGLQRVSFVHQREGEAPQRVTLWPTERPRARQRHALGTHEWDLAALALERGGRLRYWLEAEDNDTVNGPKTTRSRALHLVVYSREEAHEQTLERQRNLLELALRLLAGRLTLSPGTHERKVEFAQTAAQLQRQQAQLLDGLRLLRRQMQLDPLVPAATRRSVDDILRSWRRIDDREQRLLAALRALDRPKPPSRGAPMPATTIKPEQQRALLAYNKRFIGQLEGATLLLAGLLDEQQLQKISLHAQALKRARRGLQELLERYRKEPSPELRAQILATIGEMQRRIDQLTRQLASLHPSIPDEYLNAEAIQRLDVRHDLDQLRQTFERGQPTDLDQALQALDDKLSQLQRLAQGNVDTFRNARLAERERALNRALDRVRALETEQRSAAKTTKNVLDRYRKRGSELLQGRVGDRLREQLAQAKRLRQQLAPLDLRGLPGDLDQDLERSREWAESLEEGLEQRDLQRSLRMAQELHEGLRRLREDFGDAAVGGYFLAWQRAHGDTRQRLAKAESLADDLASDLEALLPNPASLMTPQERAQLRRGANHQRALERAARALRRRKPKASEEQGDVFGSKEERLLDQASRLMRDAAGKLRNLRLQQAHDAQRSAAQRLADLRRALRKAQEPRQGQTQASYRHRVRIPGAEAYHAPEAFRGQLLDAMREQAPASYEREVKQYYEELVR